MTLDEAISKCKKLLAVSANHARHGTLEEATSASARAAAIMAEYQIEEASLQSISDIDSASNSVDSHPFDGENSKRKSHWRMKVASACAKVNSCKSYWATDSGQIFLIGRKADVQASKYLFDVIVSQIEPLADNEWKRLSGIRLASQIRAKIFKLNDGVDDLLDFSSEESKRTWKHSFLLGCAKTVSTRIVSQYLERLRELNNQAKGDSKSSNALVVLDNRIAKVNDYLKHMYFIPTTGPRTTSQHGYLSGKEAGNRVNINSSVRGYLGSQKKELR